MSALDERDPTVDGDALGYVLALARFDANGGELDLIEKCEEYLRRRLADGPRTPEARRCEVWTTGTIQPDPQAIAAMVEKMTPEERARFSSAAGLPYMHPSRPSFVIPAGQRPANAKVCGENGCTMPKGHPGSLEHEEAYRCELTGRFAAVFGRAEPVRRHREHGEACPCPVCVAQTRGVADLRQYEDDLELAAGLVEERTNAASDMPHLVEDIALALAAARAEGRAKRTETAEKVWLVMQSSSSWGYDPRVVAACSTEARADALAERMQQETKDGVWTVEVMPVDEKAEDGC